MAHYERMILNTYPILILLVFFACSNNCNVNFNSYLYCLSVCFGSKLQIKNGTYAAIFHCNVTSCVFSIVVLNLDKAGQLAIEYITGSKLFLPELKKQKALHAFNMHYATGKQDIAVISSSQISRFFLPVQFQWQCKNFKCGFKFFNYLNSIVKSENSET